MAADRITGGFVASQYPGQSLLERVDWSRMYLGQRTGAGESEAIRLMERRGMPGIFMCRS